MSDAPLNQDQFFMYTLTHLFDTQTLISGADLLFPAELKEEKNTDLNE